MESFTRDDVKRLISGCINNITAQSEGIILEDEGGVITLPDYVDALIVRMKKGMKRIGGEEYTKGTIKAWNSFAKLIREFYSDFKERNKRDFKWEDFKLTVSQSFLAIWNAPATSLPVSTNM